MKRILKNELDQFYTKDKVAIDIIETLNLNDFELVIDPCAGKGAFYNNIKINKIGLDIDPKIDIEKIDFLKWQYNGEIKPKNTIFLTNPPFGKQGSLAIKFFNHASKFSDTIGFILPLSFSKDSMKSKLNKYFHLEKEIKIKENSFILDEKDYDVKCIFQLWKRKDHKRESYKQIKTEGFEWVKKSDNPSITIRRVGVYAGKAFLDIDKNENSHYFLKFDKKINLENIIEEINSIKWIDKTVGPRSIAKTELTPILNEIIKNQNL
jgi:predicted RNA methylase